MIKKIQRMISFTGPQVVWIEEHASGREISFAEQVRKCIDLAMEQESQALEPRRGPGRPPKIVIPEAIPVPKEPVYKLLPAPPPPPPGEKPLKWWPPVMHWDEDYVENPITGERAHWDERTQKWIEEDRDA